MFSECYRVLERLSRGSKNSKGESDVGLDSCIVVRSHDLVQGVLQQLEV